MRRHRLAAAVAGALVVPLALTACTPKPLADLTLPGGTATGSDGYTVTAYFENTANLVPNAQVLYDNAAIGTVRSIGFDTDKATGHWQAKVRLSLLKSHALPSDVTLKIGQKSLLGAEYLEIDVPAGSTVAAMGSLQQHQSDPIATTRTGNYPETEQVLTGVALLLGNGGLGQIKTITTEVDQLFHGTDKQAYARDLIKQLNATFGILASQKNQIVSLIHSIDGLGKLLAVQRNTIATAIDHIDPGLKLLAQQRAHLTSALKSVQTLSTTGKKIIKESGDSLVNNLTALEPTLKALNASGVSLPQSLLEVGVFPFPTLTAGNSFKGDYGNLYAVLNLSLPDLASNFGVPSAITGLLNQPSAALGSGNPMTLPLTVTKKPTSTSTTTKPTAPAKKTTTKPPASPSPSPSPSCNLLTALLGKC